MKLSHWLAASTLFLGLVAPPALAGKKSSDNGKKKQTTEQVSDEESKYKQIKMGQIQEFKPTYRKAKDILADITTFESQLKDMRQSTKDAADIARDEPLKKAFNKMKRTAGDKLVVTLEEGRIPRVSAKDAPDNVTGFVDQVNANVDVAQGIIAGAKALPDELETLATEMMGIPTRITPDLMKKNDLKVKDLNKQVNVAKHNLEATKEAKPRAEGVLKAARQYVSLVKDLAGT